MQKRHSWKKESPQPVLSGPPSALISARHQVVRRALLASQGVQAYTDELERLKRELESANQMKDEFLSIASHEMRTPITVIRAHAQMIERNIAKRRDVSYDLSTLITSLKIIDEQTRHLSLLVDNLVDSSSNRDGKMQLRRQLHDLAALCRKVVEEQRLLSGRLIELELPPEPVILRLDHQRMSQVVTNIISNALKYSPADLPVRVRVDQRDNVAVLQVSDAGPGIAADQQTRIFEPFYRTPEAQRSSKRGLGLGLAICKDIVEQHEGRIWCDSSVGKGSTFVVELPLAMAL